MTSSLRVLIVEDEYLVARFIADALEDAGYEVATCVATGEEAVEHFSAGGIDLAILDIKLKGALSGIDVAEAARKFGVAHLFVSGSGDPQTRAAAEATAPLAFLQKPLDERRLLTIMSKLLCERADA
jgi:DNA-binding response OmpR family regulator